MTPNGQEPARDEDLDGGWDVEQPPKPSVPAPEPSGSMASAPILRVSSRVPISPTELDSTPLDSEWDAAPAEAPPKQQAPEAQAQVKAPTGQPSPKAQVPPDTVRTPSKKQAAVAFQEVAARPKKEISNTKARKLWEREQRAKKKAAAAAASKDRKREKKAARRKAARLEAEAQAKASSKQTTKAAEPTKRVRNSEKAPRKVGPSVRPSEPAEAFDEPRSSRPYVSPAKARTLDTRTLLGVAIILAIVMAGVWFVSRH
ncbi:MAG: hypothetical protein SFV15_23600 [Polyangiaceae bacterium]|nr:hypothetical protein [Polyangiaceae bacterium]